MVQAGGYYSGAPGLLSDSQGRVYGFGPTSKQPKRFFDTDVLLYGHDLDAPAKRDIALDLIEQAWSDLDPATISVQVLQEFFMIVARRGHSPGEAATLVGDFSHWQVIDNSLALFKLGIALQTRFQLSLWDAMIPGWMKHRSVNPDYWTEKYFVSIVMPSLSLMRHSHTRAQYSSPTVGRSLPTL